MDFKIIDLEGSKYGEGMQVEKYDGVFSLVETKRYTTKDGEKKVVKKWAYSQTKDQEPAKTAIPKKIILGKTVAEAAKNLRLLAASVEGGEAAGNSSASGGDKSRWEDSTPPAEDDPSLIPF